MIEGYEKNGNSYLSNEDGKIYKDQFIVHDGEKFPLTKKAQFKRVYL